MAIAPFAVEGVALEGVGCCSVVAALALVLAVTASGCVTSTVVIAVVVAVRVLVVVRGAIMLWVARDAVDSVAQGGTVCFVAFFDDVVAVVLGGDGVGGVGGLGPMVQSAAPVAHVLGLVLV